MKTSKIYKTMKKIFFLLALAFGLNLSAQSLSEQFDAKAYAADLSDKIITKLEINDGAIREQIQKEAYIYAESLKKHILLAEKNGDAQGKGLKEVIKMVKEDALNASGFMKTMKRLLDEEQLSALEDLL